MKTEKLIKAADELNALLFDPPEIDTKADEAEVKAAVKEAAKLLEPDDELTEDTVAVLQELGVWINQDEPEDAEEVEEDDAEEAEEAEEVTLVEAVESATSLKELKELAKVSDEFKELRSGLTKYKTVEALQKAMLVILALDEEEAEEEAPEEEAPEEEAEEAEETLEDLLEAADSLKQLKVLLADDTFADHYEELKELKLVRVLKDAMICVAKTGVMPLRKKTDPAPVEKKKPSAEKKEKKEKKESTSQVEKNELGHRVGTQADSIDIVFLESAGDVISLSAIMKKTKLSKSRIKSHVYHLVKNRGCKITEAKEGKEVAYTFKK